MSARCTNMRLALAGWMSLSSLACTEEKPKSVVGAASAAPAPSDSPPPMPSTTTAVAEPRVSRLSVPLVDESGACPSDMAQVYAFCIDRYEAPNQPGEWPLVMESAMTASAWCEKRGKRLCQEEEWERACAGPQGNAYPYGNEHEAARCVDEKEWIVKDESRIVMWPEKPAMTEVTKLYQAEKSGSRPKCASGYGVFDMTGNVEEWVVTKKKGGRADSHDRAPPGHVLKGCYWSGCYGGSKPTCKSTNAAHAETFKFYETGFRCCRDAKRR
jgi:formylglycine-generating enzyme required for sulfatase activity